MSIITLPDQVWIDANQTGRPTAASIQPPAADWRGRPAGGLWTSTLRADGSSAWVDEMLELLGGQVPIVKRHAWALSPLPAKVWEIQTRAAELDLMAIAPGPVDRMWATVAKRYDAVHMTDEAARCAFHRTPRAGEPGRGERLRMLAALTSTGMASPLDMWETESTIWFGWHFEVVADLGLLDVAAIPPAQPAT